MMNDCWVYPGYKNEKGYGRAFTGGRSVLTHRAAYEALVGPIPAGLQLDHLCRNRACYNPRHLEPVTGAENTRRGLNGVLHEKRTHCPAGHPYDAANTHVTKRGHFMCRTCMRDRMRRSRGACQHTVLGCRQCPA